VVPTDVKVGLIDRLSKTGLRVIESTSFVSPKWVPQMGDNAMVMKQIKRQEGVSYPVLAPNVKGLEDAIAAGATEVCVFGAASESFSKKNTNATVAEGFARFKPLCDLARSKGIKLRGYVSCVVGCPYEGYIKPSAVIPVAEKLIEFGCYEISLGDTIGVGTPGSISKMIEAVKASIPVEKLAIHCHDTYGQALANILVSLEKGIRVVDSSVAGLGGCPYAKGATGNVATEDVLYMLNGLGMKTGVNLDLVVDANIFITSFLGKKSESRAANALIAKKSS